MKDAIFMGMTFQNFSDILTIKVLCLLAFNVLFLVLYFTNNKFLHNLVKKISYNQIWNLIINSWIRYMVNKTINIKYVKIMLN